MFQYKKDKCTECNNEAYIVKKILPRKYCDRCNKARLFEKKVKSGFAPKPTGELVMFEIIWNSRMRVSYLSGKSLEHYYRTDFWINLFAHVLAKGRYPKFRLKMENVILLTPEEHFMFDQGYKELRDKYAKENGCDWQKVYDLEEKLRKEYQTIIVL
jgi:hypothetical protein